MLKFEQCLIAYLSGRELVAHRKFNLHYLRILFEEHYNEILYFLSNVLSFSNLYFNCYFVNIDFVLFGS
jgi:hypothetical protein